MAQPRHDCDLLLLQLIRAMTLQDHLWRGIGLLKVDAPILEFFKGDGLPGDGAAHVGARANHLEIAVKVLDLGLASHGGRTVVAIEHRSSPGGAHSTQTYTIPTPEHLCHPLNWD